MKRFQIWILSCVLLLMVSCYENSIMDYSITITDNGQYAEDLTYHIISVATPDGFGDIYYSVDKSSPTSNSYKYSPSSYQGTDSNLHEGILLKEGTTIKAVAYKSKNGTAYSTFVSDLTIGVSKWDVTIVDNGPYSEDETKHIVTITDPSWQGSIYYNCGKYDNPTSNSTPYYPKKYKTKTNEIYSGILVPAGALIKAVSYQTIWGNEYSSNIVEKDLNQWTITIIDNGPALDDNNKRIVSIVDSTYSSNDIYYTLDGSIPSSSSEKYIPENYSGTDFTMYSGILVSEDTVIKAIAYFRKEECSINSFVAELTSDITPWRISIVDHGQAFDNRTKHVIAIEDSKWNGAIKYTLDKTTPTILSCNYNPSKYTLVDGSEVEGILVSEGDTIKAVSCKGRKSEVVESVVAEEKIDNSCWEIVITDCGQFADDETKRIINITDSEKSGDIYYSLDGSIPTKDSLQYVKKKYIAIDSVEYEGILVDAETNISAISYKIQNGKIVTSSVVSKETESNKWTITIIDNGPLQSNLNSRIITIVDDKGGAIFYSVNGSEPNKSSSKSYKYTPKEYKGADSQTYYGIVINEGVTVKAVSYFNQISSFIAEKTSGIRNWEIKVKDLGQSFEDGSKHIVSITDSERYGDIYYTIDGSEPDRGSLKYSPQTIKNNNQESCEGVLIEEGTSLKAVSYKTISGQLSVSNEAEITVDTYRWLITIEDNGQYFADGSKHIISIKDSDKSGSIYYTLGESSPTLGSSLYSPISYVSNDSIEYEGILVDEGAKINAISSYTDGEKVKTSYVTIKNIDKCQWPIEIIQYVVAKDDETKRIVSIEDDLKNGSLFYTVDGSVPTANSVVYSPKEYAGVDSKTYTGILVDGEVELRAVSYSKDENERVISSQVAEQIVNKVVYKIGDRGPAGGYVFQDRGYYLKGYRYYEAAPKDLNSTYQFGYNADQFNVSGETGKEKTEALVSILGDGEYAAKACADYVYGGFDDWFLPTVTEMTLMGKNLYSKGIGGFSSQDDYWTSNEDGRFNARYFYFKYCNYDIKDRSNYCRVRPARVF